MKVGNIGEPTTFCSVFPFPGNWVCFCLTRRPRWAASSPTRMAGTISTWMMKNRGMITPLPG